MSAGNPSYEGSQQSDTPLPAVAARAARRAIAGAAAAAARSRAANAAAAQQNVTFTFAQSLARLGLTAAIMAGLTAVFAAFVLPVLQLH